MARIGFASYEIHPTTWGGTGVLIRHAIERLLSEGHEVVLLLDIPETYFHRFDTRDRLALPNAERCRAYHVDALCAQMQWKESDFPDPFVWKSARFDHALARLLEHEPLDVIEFFEYCGVAAAALAAKLYGVRHAGTTLSVRVHNSVQWIDHFEATKPVDLARHRLYGLEHAGLALAESVLVPSAEYSDAYCRDRYGLEDSRRVVSEPPIQEFGRRPLLDDAKQNEAVYYGRIFEFKGVERFVSAALIYLARHPESDLRFVLIGPTGNDAPGGGPYDRYLQGLIPDAQRDRFEFTGHLDHEAARERFGRARFAAFPNRFESFCYAVHEVYDAGVPVAVADLPAFRRYFRDGENALVVADDTLSWVEAMERLASDAPLRERLSRPYGVTKDPLGSFYQAPRACRPVGAHGKRDAEEPRVCVVVVVPAGTSPAYERKTLGTVAPGLAPGDRLWVAREVVDAGETAPLFSWLGEPRRLEDAAGVVHPPEDACLLDALWVLLAGDVPDPELLPLARRALACADPRLGFAGAWSRAADGRLHGTSLDIASELAPFEAPGRLSRAVVRTEPGALLMDHFDSRLAGLGEIGGLWRAEQEWGRGCLLPEVRLDRSPLEEASPVRDPERLAFLVSSVAAADQRERLARVAVVLEAVSGVSHATPPAAAPSLEAATSQARANLNGRILLGLAWEKLTARLRRAGRKG